MILEGLQEIHTQGILHRVNFALFDILTIEGFEAT